jgi:hypothetical protein
MNALKKFSQKKNIFKHLGLISRVKQIFFNKYFFVYLIMIRVSFGKGVLTQKNNLSVIK